jgi:hypothetical protein
LPGSEEEARVEGAASERERVRRELVRNGWRIDVTVKELGLKDRHELRRLMEKLGIERPGK